MKLTASDSDIDEVFKSTDQSIMAKIKNCASKDLIVLDAISKYSIKIIQCQYKEKNSIKNKNIK